MSWASQPPHVTCLSKDPFQVSARLVEGEQRCAVSGACGWLVCTLAAVSFSEWQVEGCVQGAGP
jgi:hypothetical protein